MVTSYERHPSHVRSLRRRPGIYLSPSTWIQVFLSRQHYGNFPSLDKEVPLPVLTAVGSVLVFILQILLFFSSRATLPFEPASRGLKLLWQLDNRACLRFDILPAYFLPPDCSCSRPSQYSSSAISHHIGITSFQSILFRCTSFIPRTILIISLEDFWSHIYFTFHVYHLPISTLPTSLSQDITLFPTPPLHHTYTLVLTSWAYYTSSLPCLLYTRDRCTC